MTIVAEPAATTLPTSTETATAVTETIAIATTATTTTATVSPEATPHPLTETGSGAQSGETPDATSEVIDVAMPVDSALLELGKKVYRLQACGVCHTLAAVGSLGTFGPPHDNLATVADERIHEERYKGTATTPAEYIRQSIVDPQAFFVEGYQITRFPMPIFTNLSEQEVDALVYLLMQPPPPARP